MAANDLQTTKLANCTILGVIGALKIALASKLQPQGANWQVMNFVIISPCFYLFLPLLNGHFLIAEEGKPLNDFPRIATVGCVWNFQIGGGSIKAIFQSRKLKFDTVLYFGLINSPTVAKKFSCKNGF